MGNISSVSYSMPQAILDDIDDERKRQNVKWGDQSGNTNPVWVAILTEEVGEVAQAVLKSQWLPAHKFGALRWCIYCTFDPENPEGWPGITKDGPCPAPAMTMREHLRKELIQVIAVGVAWVEALDAAGRSPGVQSVMSGSVVDE